MTSPSPRRLIRDGIRGLAVELAATLAAIAIGTALSLVVLWAV